MESGIQDSLGLPYMGRLEVWKDEGKEFSDIRVAWDWIKYNVRLFSMQYSKELARIKREKEQSLQKCMFLLLARFHARPMSYKTLISLAFTT